MTTIPKHTDFFAFKHRIHSFIAKRLTHTVQPIVFIVCLLVSVSIHAIEKFTISIGELESAEGSVKNISGDFRLNTDSTFGLNIEADSLILKPPYQALQAIKFECSSFIAQQNHLICKNGLLDLTTESLPTLSIPFDLQVSPRSETGDLKITEIPFTEKNSTLEYQWLQQQWRVSPTINALAIKVLMDLFNPSDLSVSDGLVSLHGEVTSPVANQLDANLELIGDDVSLQTKDATKAIEKLKVQSTVNLHSTPNQTHGKVDFQLQDGEVYLEPIYLSLKDDAITGSTNFSLDRHNNTLQLTNFILSHFPTFSLTGSLETTLEKSFPPNQGEISVQIYQLAELFNHYIAPYLNTNSLKPVLSNTNGLILSDLNFANKQLVHFRLSTADLSATYTFNDKDISIDSANLSLNWQPKDCTEQSFVYWKSADFRGVPLSETVLRFKACGQQINFERNVLLPLLDGEMQFEHLDIKKLDNGSVDLSFATEIKDISLSALSKAFDLPPLAGYISASIPSVRLEKGGLRLDSSIHINVFGGNIEIKDLQIDGMLGSYPILTANITFNKLDLGKLSKRFSFGHIEGKLNGTVKNLRIENQKIIAFDAAFSTPEGRLLPYSISQKAVENIASLGGSGPADLLSRGILKMFESFFYSRLGFRCKLRNNVCELEGIAAAENNGFYLIKGAIAPQINVIGYNRRVNWDELARRLKRISSQSAPVIH